MQPTLPPPQRMARSGSSTAITPSATEVSVAGRASAYLDAPAEKLTLPELVKEFKSIQMMKEPALQSVRYTMKHPKEKVVLSPATAPVAEK